MPRTLITRATVVLPDRLARSQTVAVEEGAIAAVAPDGVLSPHPDDDVVDANGKFLAPGFMDLHIHGTHRFLVDNGADDLRGLCGLLPRYGVTGFLPTVAPRTKGEDAHYLASLASCTVSGASILGFHLEGPFLALTGALPPGAIGTADPERVKSLQAATGDVPLVFSTSPDFSGICDLIPIMRESGPVFMTHTRADVAQAQRAIDAGARHATHFYDVFPCPDERDPGVRPCGAVEAILADERVTVDFILDGEHVDPVAVQMALRCKGPDKVCLITDANMGAGLPPGRYQWGKDGIEIAYPGGPARMTKESRFPGGLAGSGLTMNLAVRNAVRLFGIALPQAVRMATANPAAVLGLQDRKGLIAQDFDADLTLFDENIVVSHTWVAGKLVFSGRDTSGLLKGARDV